MKQNEVSALSDSYTVTAIDRAMDVLECLARQGEELRLAELTEKTDIPKSTLFRILSTLEDRECVVRDEDRKTYRLGMKLWELGNAFLDQSDLHEAAADYMKRLADACGESVFLGVWDDSEVVYVRRVESPKSAVVVRKLGQRAPVHCTATGLALLAFQPDEAVERFFQEQELEAVNEDTTTSPEALRDHLHRIRDTQVAVVDGEYNPALLCVSSPILDESGRPLAAFTAALLSGQASDERITEVKEHVREAAEDLSREQGYLGDHSRAHGFSSSR
jgi:DNA-binding IclR family transcriptional regulator